MTTRALPDIGSALIEYLLGVLEVADEVEDRIWGVAPEGAAYPHLTIRRIGGRVQGRPHWVDRALIEVAAWADESRTEAHDLCALAIAALHDLPMDVVGEACVTAVQDATGPRPIPDPVTSRPRFIGEVNVTYHPARQGS